MKYGIAIHNLFEETERKNGGKKIVFKKSWNVYTGVRQDPVLWDSEEEVHEFADEQVWDYKVLEFDDDGNMTLENVEDYKTHKPNSNV